MQKKWFFILTAMIAAVLCVQLFAVNAATFTYEETYEDYDLEMTMDDMYMSFEWTKLFGSGNAAVQGEKINI